MLEFNQLKQQFEQLKVKNQIQEKEISDLKNANAKLVEAIQMVQSDIVSLKTVIQKNPDDSFDLLPSNRSFQYIGTKEEQKFKEQKIIMNTDKKRLPSMNNKQKSDDLPFSQVP